MPLEFHIIARYNGRTVSENGQSPPETLLCGRCATTYDAEDNFCRQCGLSLRDDPLPVPNESNMPTIWQPPLPVAVVKGAAFVAAGTIAEFLLRRIVGRAFRATTQHTQSPVPSQPASVEQRNGSQDEATHVVSETLLMRTIRFRR